MTGLLVGLTLTCFGLYQLGYALTAESTPYGIGFVVAVVSLLLGGGVLLATRRVLASRHTPGGITPVTAAVGVILSIGALSAGLLQLPADDREQGPLCRAGNGNVYDCDDPRIDEPQEKADVVR